jgi:hypothetical protein
MKRFPSIPATSPRFRRLALGLTAVQVAASSGIPLNRLCLIERRPLVATNEELDLIERTVARMVAADSTSQSEPRAE